MTEDTEPMYWKLAAGGSAILATMATRSAIKKGWRLFKKSDPPDDPASRHVSWGDALLFTALTGAAVEVSRLLATRGAARGWEALSHSERSLK